MYKHVPDKEMHITVKQKESLYPLVFKESHLKTMTYIFISETDKDFKSNNIPPCLGCGKGDLLYKLLL